MVLPKKMINNLSFIEGAAINQAFKRFFEHAFFLLVQWNIAALIHRFTCG